jgi:hypothetical protein
MMPYDLVMCPLNSSEGHHYANGGLTSTLPLLLTQTFVTVPLYTRGPIAPVGHLLPRFWAIYYLL